jgi:hypothetical protein
MATKKTPPAKAAGINIDIDLGPLMANATPEQLARLKAYVENHVITWVTKDLKKPAPIIDCHEKSWRRAW